MEIYLQQWAARSEEHHLLGTSSTARLNRPHPVPVGACSLRPCSACPARRASPHPSTSACPPTTPTFALAGPAPLTRCIARPPPAWGPSWRTGSACTSPPASRKASCTWSEPEPEPAAASRQPEQAGRPTHAPACCWQGLQRAGQPQQLPGLGKHRLRATRRRSGGIGRCAARRAVGGTLAPRRRCLESRIDTLLFHSYLHTFGL